VSYEFVAEGRAGPAAVLNRVVGFDQAGFPNQTLATPLVARVSDLFGNAVVGFTVRYSIIRGSGHLSSIEAVSDSIGLTQVFWTLGSEVTGIPDSAIAEGDGLSGSPLVYTALILPP
jgi:hypothetical protein